MTDGNSVKEIALERLESSFREISLFERFKLFNEQWNESIDANTDDDDDDDKRYCVFVLVLPNIDACCLLVLANPPKRNNS